jgi:hypothetical protein
MAQSSRRRIDSYYNRLRYRPASWYCGTGLAIAAVGVSYLGARRKGRTATIN